jgi:glycerophosphoryl diester phosphodiesterase
MQSSPSGADPLDPGPKGFAHRGLHHGPEFPENSFRAFSAALELGCGIECDLRLTAEGEVVVFHDADARRLCGSPLVIGRASAADLARLRVGEQPIPTLAGLLQLVEGRVPLLLEVKTGRDLWRWVPALRRELDGYPGPFGVMSFDPRLVRLLRTNLPQIRRGLVMRGDLAPWRRRLFLALADPQFLAVETSATTLPWVQRLRTRMPAYSWTARTREQRGALADATDALIWEGDGRP